LGTVTCNQWAGLAKDQFKVADLPEAVYVKFDDPNIASKFPESEKEGGSMRIELEKSRQARHSYHTQATTAHTQLGHKHKQDSRLDIGTRNCPFTWLLRS
jgi:hypothetical protein